MMGKAAKKLQQTAFGTGLFGGSFKSFVFAMLGSALLAACQPTVKIEAPDRPIEINLNVKIEQEIRVKVERDLDALLASNPELF